MSEPDALAQKWVPFYCSACNAYYCRVHSRQWMESDTGFTDHAGTVWRRGGDRILTD